MPKIIILIFYYGKFPWYFNYFLHSCKYNSDIDFLIFSDSMFDGRLPPNVTIIVKSIEEINMIMSERMGFEINIDMPYKFCDLKPAYGFLMPDYILGYDFWGYCDIDIIFGNIRNFITNDLLTSFDIVSVLYDFLSGYFAVFRNCKKVNELFKESKDYKKVFMSHEHFCFDECNFMFPKIDEGIRLEDIDYCIDSMTHVVKRLHAQQIVNAHFDTYSLQGLGGKLKWRKGELVYKNRYEILLYHLIKFKNVYERKPPKRVPDTFRISTRKIY